MANTNVTLLPMTIKMKGTCEDYTQLHFRVYIRALQFTRDVSSQIFMITIVKELLKGRRKDRQNY